MSDNRSLSLDALAAAMHVAYEARAAMVGWETQTRSRVPYEALPEANKASMRAGVLALLEVLTADGWRRVPPCCTCSLSGVPHPSTPLCARTLAADVAAGLHDQPHP